ncbi:hypothetical protein EGT07_00370 [Herbaspirillum sp. HC18]|nr:hypothetical protein EGT07_00370 [Herbaspirillum sp. HC18]
MKNSAHQPDIMKRKLLTLLACMPWFTACRATSNNLSTDPEDIRLREKFRGIYGGVLRLDASSPKHGVMITSETGRYISSPATLGPNHVGNQTYTDSSLPLPKAIHVTWREGDYKYQGQGVWTGGTIIGDYTVPVAERIPDEVLDYIRRNGGALRLKIRLKDDGVLIGWDVEEWYTTQYGRGLRWVRPGGDFREAQIRDGNVIDPGWQK